MLLGEGQEHRPIGAQLPLQIMPCSDSYPQHTDTCYSTTFKAMFPAAIDENMMTLQCGLYPRVGTIRSHTNIDTYLYE